MKKILSLVILASLIILESMVPVKAASPIVGAKCSKVNQMQNSKGLNLKCTKKGKKLYWVQKSKSDSVIPEKIVRYPEALQVQKIFDEAKVLVEPNEVSFDFIFQNLPPVPLSNSTSSQPGMIDIAYWTEKGLAKSVDFYSQFALPVSDGRIVVFLDKNWANQTLLSLGCQAFDGDAAGWIVPAWSCTDQKTRIVSIDWRARYGIPIDDIEFQHILAHEYFHQVQVALLSSQHHPIPMWMLEGGAQFFSAAAFASWNTQKPYEQWLNDLLNTRSSGGYDVCLSVDYSKVTDGPWEVRRCAYSKGAKAVENLVANYGVSAYVEILKLTRSQSFESAFELTTGKSLRDFYADTEIFLKRQGWSS